MPELPEVQTIVNDLNRKIKGYIVVDFWSDWKKTIKNVSFSKFTKEIVGRRVLGVRRIGKNIFIDMSSKNSYSDSPEKTLYIHLKMTGHLLVKGKNNTKKEKDNFSEKVNQYVHHIWKLKSRRGKLKTLEFSDLRKFGKIVWVDYDKVKELPEIKSLGIDVMHRSFNLDKFKGILDRKKKSSIGLTLMDQSLIAGIGNIYRSEILFEAGVDPNKKNSKLSEKEIKKIFSEIKKILKKAIKLRGTSDSDYRDTSGEPGKFHKVLKVYRRDGKKCKKCANIIERIKIGQRSVFLCSRCQK